MLVEVMFNGWFGFVVLSVDGYCVVLLFVVGGGCIMCIDVICNLEKLWWF